MKELIFLFELFCIISLVSCVKKIEYLSNFKDGNIVYGQESLMTDYVTVASDPNPNLPNQFTVCSSLFINFKTTKSNFIQVYKKDGTHWFELSFFAVGGLTKIDSETLVLYYDTGKYLQLFSCTYIHDVYLLTNNKYRHHKCFGSKSKSQQTLVHSH